MDLNYIIKIACNFIFIALSRASCHLPRPLLSNDEGFNNAVIESDSAIAIGLVEHDTSPLHPYAPLIMKIRQFQNMDWIIAFHHTLREGNECANWFAKKGATSNVSLKI
jgi:hypothetical protein